MYCRAKHNNQEKKYPFIEGRSDKNFRVVNLFMGSIFAIILFCTVMLFGSQAWYDIISLLTNLNSYFDIDFLTTTSPFDISHSY